MPRKDKVSVNLINEIHSTPLCFTVRGTANLSFKFPKELGSRDHKMKRLYFADSETKGQYCIRKEIKHCHG